MGKKGKTGEEDVKPKTRKIKSKSMKNQPILSKPDRMVGNISVKEWQRMPRQILFQYCQKQKLARPSFTKPRPVHVDGKLFYQSVVFVADPQQDSLKNTVKIGPTYLVNECDVGICEEISAMMAIWHFAPSLPIERLIPGELLPHWRETQVYCQHRLDKETALKEKELRKLEKKRHGEIVKHKEKYSSKYSQLLMDEKIRKYITQLLRQEYCDESEDGSGDQGHHLHHRVKESLLSKGFELVDVSSIPVSCLRDVNKALEWLMVNVPEYRLPHHYHKSLNRVQVVHDGRVGGTERYEELEDLGFPVIYLEKLASKFESNDTMVEHAFMELYTYLNDYLLVKDDDDDENDVVNDEMMVLNEIYGDMFQSSDKKWSVSIPNVHIISEVHADILLVLSEWKHHPYRYPSSLPLIFIKSAALNSEQTMLLTQAIIEYVSSNSLQGEPLTYDLVQWIQDSTFDVLSSSMSQVQLPIQWFKEDSAIPQITEQKSNSPPKKSSNRPKNFRSLKRCDKTDKQLEEYLNKLQATKDYQKMLSQRRLLPIYSYREQILDLIAQSQTSILCAETGAGKSTQAAQFILNDMISKGAGSICKIICTQPRRISAIGLAERVSQERNEQLGVNIGYSVRLQSKYSSNTKLIFVTTGILVNLLTSDPLLSDVSHIIVDEVHERSVQIDLILLMLKQIILSGKRPDLKIVLMSATLDSKTFSSYFNKAPTISVPGRTFGVSTKCLDEFIGDPKFEFRSGREYRVNLSSDKEEKRREELQSFCTNELAIDHLLSLDECNIDPMLYCSVVWFILENHVRTHTTSSENAILIFVPGMADIQSITKALVKSASEKGALKNLLVLTLHSSLTPEEQHKIFKIPPPGVCKVIVSTNIAETSVTIPDVVYVIDSGRMNQIEYDPARGLSTLQETWISKANAKQRMGRAGRVREGHCFRMYTSEKYSKMSDYQLPEILRTPLDSACLQAKLLMSGLENKKHQSISIQKLFKSSIDPPDADNVKAATEFLHTIGALDSSENVTPLGSILSRIPVPNIRLGKMILFGAIFQCATPIITVAALLSERSPFVSPYEKRAEASQAKSRFKCGLSDHLSLVKAFDAWFFLRKNSSSRALREFCSDNFISNKSMETALSIMKQYSRALKQIGFMTDSTHCEQSVPKGARFSEEGFHFAAIAQEIGVSSVYDKYSDSMMIARCLLSAGLYPNAIKVRLPDSKYAQTVAGSVVKNNEVKAIKFYCDKDRVFIHPGSVMFSVSKYSNPWMIYLEKRQTSKLFIYDCSVVSAYSLLFFGGDIHIDHDKHQIKMDNWIVFNSSAKVSVLVKQLRDMFNNLILDKFQDPSLEISQSHVVEAIVALLESDGIDNSK